MAIRDKTKFDGRRISPGGMIDLPFTVRKALGFRKGESKLLEVQVEKGEVRIAAAEKAGPNTVEASPRGLLKIPKEAHAVLSKGQKGRYALTPQSELQGKGSDRIFYLRPASGYKA
jgi:bifunctional DNA-binding transcriptional regulator/antitoxin component of YhaV-PrlF toxin-antitoxin module